MLHAIRNICFYNIYSSITNNSKSNNIVFLNIIVNFFMNALDIKIEAFIILCI
jgi:hypothetical protein